MKERAIISNEPYSFSSQTIICLLDTYSQWAPIKEDDHFLLKVTADGIEIEKNTEYIVYQIPSKSPY